MSYNKFWLLFVCLKCHWLITFPVMSKTFISTRYLDSFETHWDTWFGGNLWCTLRILWSSAEHKFSLHLFWSLSRASSLLLTPTAFTNFAINPIIKWRCRRLKGKGWCILNPPPPSDPKSSVPYWSPEQSTPASRWDKAMHVSDSEKKILRKASCAVIVTDCTVNSSSS